MEVIFFALISFFGWGFGDLFVTISARKLNAYSATVWGLLISVILLSLYIPFSLDSLQNLTASVFILNLFLGFILIIGILTFREALVTGSSPVIVVISTSYAMITTILSIIFFQERLNYSQVAAITLVFIGLFLSILDLKLLLKRKVLVGKGVMLALVSALAWGVYFTFIKIPVQEIGWFWPNYFSFLFFIPFVFWFIKMKGIKLNRPNYNNGFLPLFLGVILARISELSFNLGISKGYSSIVAPIAGANPVLFVILSTIFLKDPITKQQIMGIITTLVGIILLSVAS